MEQLLAYSSPLFPQNKSYSPEFSISIAGKYTMLDNHSMPTRSINEYVVILCTDGEGWVELNNCGAQSVNAGDILFLPPNVLQRYGSAQNAYWSLLWFHCGGSLADYYFKCITDTFSGMNIPFTPKCNTYTFFEKITDIFKSLSSYTQLLNAQAVASQMFCEILQANQGKSVPTLHEATMRKARLLLDSTTDYNLSLDALCEEFGLSKYYFIKLFKSSCGFTPMEYFQQVKLKKSCTLLAQNKLSISEIAEHLSYSTPYHFSKAFKQYFGFSPSSFKKLL